jgi:hypothetical protein
MLQYDEKLSHVFIDEDMSKQLTDAGINVANDASFWLMKRKDGTRWLLTAWEKDGLKSDEESEVYPVYSLTDILYKLDECPNDREGRSWGVLKFFKAAPCYCFGYYADERRMDKDKKKKTDLPMYKGHPYIEPVFDTPLMSAAHLLLICAKEGIRYTEDISTKYGDVVPQSAIKGRMEKKELSQKSTEIATKKDPEPLYVNFVLMTCDKENANGRVYPRKLMEDAVKDFNKNLSEKGDVFGICGERELDGVPKNDVDTKLCDITHKVGELHINDQNQVTGTIAIFDTPRGKMVKDFLRHNIALAPVLVGYGEPDDNGVMKKLDIKTIDICEKDKAVYPEAEFFIIEKGE